MGTEGALDRGPMRTEPWDGFTKRRHAAVPSGKLACTAKLRNLRLTACVAGAPASVWKLGRKAGQSLLANVICA